MDTRFPGIILAILIAISLLLPPTVAFAGGSTDSRMDSASTQESDHPAKTGPANPYPIPIHGPRLTPTAVPHTMVLNLGTVYNILLVPGQLPEQSLQAAAANGSRVQESPGRYVRQNSNRAVRIDDRDAARGLTLYAQESVCNDFDKTRRWASRMRVSEGLRSDIWTDWYGGWGPFAIDDGIYQAKNTTFSLERTVGPGKNYGEGYSAKIAGYQPYAGGFGSPLIKVKPHAEVTVKVNYLIADHNDHGMDYDWASLGIKPDAAGNGASYVNGYTRGQWSQMEHTILAGESGYVMVLIQGHSPGALNSNIYFDDVRIAVNGGYLKKCVLEKDTD